DEEAEQARDFADGLHNTDLKGIDAQLLFSEIVEQNPPDSIPRVQEKGAYGDGVNADISAPEDR
ncbi:hypothetical protein AMJ82_09220, partial [candidate division TA06 bacterium SM23_40]